mgnify:CR=1 FL=1
MFHLFKLNNIIAISPADSKQVIKILKLEVYLTLIILMMVGIEITSILRILWDIFI